jgi:hypothetical protein
LPDVLSSGLVKSKALDDAGSSKLAAALQQRVQAVGAGYATLKATVAGRGRAIEAARLRFQFEADADEASSWMHEKRPLFADADYGQDEAATDSHLRRLEKNELELKGYRTVVRRLETVKIADVEGMVDPTSRSSPSGSGGAVEPPKDDRTELFARYKYEGRCIIVGGLGWMAVGVWGWMVVGGWGWRVADLWICGFVDLWICGFVDL